MQMSDQMRNIVVAAMVVGVIVGMMVILMIVSMSVMVPMMILVTVNLFFLPACQNSDLCSGDAAFYAFFGCHAYIGDADGIESI